MKQKYLNIFSTFLRYVLLGSAVLFLLVCIVIAGKRLNYPFELEWVEGNLVHQVERILSGKQIYVEPSIDFTAQLYAPLYFYISAMVAKVLGIGFLPMRLVSFLSSLGCFALIFQFVRRETKSIFYGVLSAGLFAATFRINGGYFDIGKVDMLFMLLTLASIYFLRFRQDFRSVVFAAVLISLAFLTKQTAFVIAIALSIYCFFAYDRWRRYLFFLTFLLLAGISTAILNWVSEGWYYYYLFELPTQHPIAKRMVLGFWRDDVIAALPIAMGISLAYLGYQFTNNKKGDFIFFGLLFTSMIGASWLSRMHSGGWLNVLLPAYSVIAIFFGLGLHWLLSERLNGSPNSGLDASGKNDRIPAKRKYIKLAVLTLCISQFLFLSYKPGAYLPTHADEVAANSYVSLLRELDGDIFMAEPAFFPTLAGKKTFSDGSAMPDILRSSSEEQKKNLEADFKKAICEGRFDVIIAGKGWFRLFEDSSGLVKEIDKRYVDTGSVYTHKSIFYYAKTGNIAPGVRLYRLRDGRN